jgi:hypothetical protein
MELEQAVTEQAVVYKPKKRDSAGRTEQQARAMDLPPRPGSRSLVPGGKEQIALGGNAPQPPPISQIDEAYAVAAAEGYAEYPRAFYHRAFKRERDTAGKAIPGGEVTPLATADAISPNYPTPANIAQRNGIKGILATSEGSPAIIGQHLYRTRFVPSGWQAGDKIDLAACKKEEAELLKAGWFRTPGELNLPKARTVEEESDE